MKTIVFIFIFSFHISAFAKEIFELKIQNYLTVCTEYVGCIPDNAPIKDITITLHEYNPRLFVGNYYEKRSIEGHEFTFELVIRKEYLNEAIYEIRSSIKFFQNERPYMSHSTLKLRNPQDLFEMKSIGPELDLGYPDFTYSEMNIWPKNKSDFPTKIFFQIYSTTNSTK